jgi:pimeloyl-ACP methyl ester carboxylesterase
MALVSEEASRVTPREQARARYPDETGRVVRDGVGVAWERYGDGDPAILLLPTWSIIHSRLWKGQIPYLSRSYRVLTFDGRGNGRSDRPTDPAAYSSAEFVADAVAVLDASGTDRAVVVGFSMGAGWLLRLAADHPERVLGGVYIGGGHWFQDPERRPPDPLFEPLDADDDWSRWPMEAWGSDWRAFAAFFFRRMCSEPHSTKQIEDCVGWALETDAATIVASEVAPYLTYDLDGTTLTGDDAVRAMAARIRCPSLVVHGTGDRIAPFAMAPRLAEVLGADLVALDGSGHAPMARDPVAINLLLRDFVRSVADRCP